MPHLTAEKLARIPIPLPPLEKQRAIAGYLDRETARIDTLIEEQQRLVEILRERRFALRTQSLYTGQPQLKRSRIPCLGHRCSPPTGASFRSYGLLTLKAVTRRAAREEWWTDSYIPWVSLHDVGRCAERSTSRHGTAHQRRGIATVPPVCSQRERLSSHETLLLDAPRSWAYDGHVSALRGLGLRPAS